MKSSVATAGWTRTADDGGRLGGCGKKVALRCESQTNRAAGVPVRVGRSGPSPDWRPACQTPVREFPDGMRRIRDWFGPGFGWAGKDYGWARVIYKLLSDIRFH